MTPPTRKDRARHQLSRERDPGGQPNIAYLVVWPNVDPMIESLTRLSRTLDAGRGSLSGGFIPSDVCSGCGRPREGQDSVWQRISDAATRSHPASWHARVRPESWAQTP